MIWTHSSVQSRNRSRSLWRKLALEPQHEHFASLRERYWQNVLLRMHDGLYTVRFNHVDFEVPHTDYIYKDARLTHVRP